MYRSKLVCKRTCHPPGSCSWPTDGHRQWLASLPGWIAVAACGREAGTPILGLSCSQGQDRVWVGCTWEGGLAEDKMLGPALELPRGAGDSAGGCDCATNSGCGTR